MVTNKHSRPSTKRDQIVAKAIELFSRHGARRITIGELCREAGVSKVTFYKHFANKVELVRCIRDEWVEEGMRKFDQINAQDIPFPAKIDLMTAWKAEQGARLNVSFIKEVVSMDDVHERFKRGYLGNLTRAQEQGELRADINLEFLWMVLEKVGELYLDGSWKRLFDNPGELNRQMRTLIFYGLLSREPAGEERDS